METQTLHRGRLIDHLQLVVKDLAASQRFYSATLAALDIPIGGAGEGYFWADELFVTSIDSPAAPSRRKTGPWWIASIRRPSPTAARTTAPPVSGSITPATTPPLSSIRTATISKLYITARQSAVRSRWKFGFRNKVEPRNAPRDDCFLFKMIAS
jgi:hypothetical protein